MPPLPTLAQEIRATEPASQVPPAVTVRVSRVEFDSNGAIPEIAKEEFQPSYEATFSTRIGNCLLGRFGQRDSGSYR